jgi:hypothetical protein
LDVTDRDAAFAAVRQAQERFGRLDRRRLGVHQLAAVQGRDRPLVAEAP